LTPDTCIVDIDVEKKEKEKDEVSIIESEEQHGRELYCARLSTTTA